MILSQMLCTELPIEHGIEHPVSELDTSKLNPYQSDSWQVELAGCCWLESLTAEAQRIELVLEYVDGLGRQRQRVDVGEAHYMEDALLAGRVRLRGFGPLVEARLILVTERAGSVFNVQDLQLNVLDSSLNGLTVKRPALISAAA